MYHICSNTQFLIVLFGYSKNCDFGECLFDILYFSDIIKIRHKNFIVFAGLVYAPVLFFFKELKQCVCGLFNLKKFMIF